MATSMRARLKKGVLIAAGLLIVATVGCAWYFLPVQYEAFALLRVASKPPAVLGGGRAAEDFGIFKRTQVQLILSSAVLQGTLRDPAISKLSIVKAHEGDAVAWLKSRLTIDYPDDAEIMRVALSGPDPDEAAKIVDKVVDVYLTDIVDRERHLRLDNEAKLQQAYDKQSTQYKSELDALRTLEQIHKTSGSEAAQLKKRMAIEALNALVARRHELVTRIEENELEILLRKARADIPEETRTADPVQPAEPAESQMPLKLLEAKHEYLAAKLAELDKSVEERTNEVAGLESFSAQVAAKQEELDQLRTIRNRLGAELDRMTVERLAPPRITRVDKAVIVDRRGDAARRYLSLVLVAAFGLVLVGLGVATKAPAR